MRIKNLIIFAITMLSLALAQVSFASSAQNAKVAQIITQDGGYCSLTIIMHNNQCRGITNAHCLENDEKQVVVYTPNLSNKSSNPVDANPQEHEAPLGLEFLRDENESYLAKPIADYEKRFFAEIDLGGVADHKHKVLRIDRSKDLAEIEISQNYCQGINSIAPTSQAPEDLSCGHSVVGYSKDLDFERLETKVFYNNETKFHQKNNYNSPIYKKAQVYFERSVYENIENFLVLDQTHVLPGNSGGAVFNCNERFLGITSRQHPTQDKVYVIPKNDVIGFLDSESSDLSTQDHSHTDTIEMTGGNGSGSTTGGNGSGSTTGGNGSGSTEGSIDCTSQSNLEFFAEPLEGIIDETNKMLLAIGNYQIDGWDNFYEHQNSDDEKLYKDIDGYPNLEIRQEILQRLAGQYQFENSFHKVYAEDTYHVNDYREKLISPLSTEVLITESNLTITLSEHDRWDIPSKIHATNTVQKEDAKTINFNIELSEDAKTITLHSDSQTLICDNRNHMKLICENDNMQFSLSKHRADANYSSFRLTKKEVKVDYYYGENLEN